MDNKKLTAIFKEVHSKHFPRKLKRISAEFYPYRSIRHTVRYNAFFINVRISIHFKTAPVAILEIISLLLLAKVYRYKVSSDLRKIYRQYVEHIQSQLPVKKARNPGNYKPQGIAFNLRDIFNALNNTYFNNRLQVKNIGWSTRKSYRRLGFYNEERDLLVVSKIFDSNRVPEEIIYYLVYHEMLHVLLPIRNTNGRRIIHSKKFRELEKQYPDYKKINKWIESNLLKLR